MPKTLPPEGSKARIALDVLIRNLPEWPGMVKVAAGDEDAALKAAHELLCADLMTIEINEGAGTFRLRLNGALAPAAGTA